MSVFRLLPLGFPHPPGHTAQRDLPLTLASRALTPTRPASHTLHGGHHQEPRQPHPGLVALAPCATVWVGTVRVAGPETGALPALSPAGAAPGPGGPRPLPSSGPGMYHSRLCRYTPKSNSVSEYRCWPAAGQAGLPLPLQAHAQAEEAHIRCSVCPAPLATVLEIDRGWGESCFSSFFLNLSLLVQPQKVPYHCRMSGHTLPAGLATLDSPLIDFALHLGGSTNWRCPLAAVIP